MRFSQLFDQQSNAWVLQADRMELHGIQPEQMLIINPVIVIVAVPLMEKYLYPWLEARRIGFGQFRRIGVGMLLSVSAFVLAAFVQSQIPEDTSKLGPSVFWQTPQYQRSAHTHTHTHAASPFPSRLTSLPRIAVGTFSSASRRFSSPSPAWSSPTRRRRLPSRAP